MTLGVETSDGTCYFVVLVAKPCLTLCDPMDCSPPGPSVHGISQARTLEWAASSISRWNSLSSLSTPTQQDITGPRLRQKQRQEWGRTVETTKNNYLAGNTPLSTQVHWVERVAFTCLLRDSTVTVHVPRNRANVQSPSHGRAPWFPGPTGQRTFLQITVTCEKKAKSESVSRSGTSDSLARQAPLSVGFSRQECWSGLPLPFLGDLSNPGIELHCRQVLYYLSHQGSLRRTLNYALPQSAFPGKKCRWGQWQGVDSWNWLRTTVLFPNFYFKNSSREPIEKVYLSVRSTQTQKSHSPCQSWPHAIHFSESSPPSRVAWPGHHICGQN